MEEEDIALASITCNECCCSHLHPLDLDSPGVGGLVQAGLHDVRDGLALRQDLGQVLGAQHVAQGGGGQQAGRVTIVCSRERGERWQC